MDYKRLLFQNKKAQALVETAIIAPILIFMLIGVFEVGYVLRTYLVMQNAAREGARFSIRSGYLDYSLPNPGYEKVVTHTLTSIGDTLPLDFQTKGTLIISRISVSTPVITLTNYIPGTEPYDCRVKEEGIEVHKSCIFTGTTLLNRNVISNYYAIFPITSTFESKIDVDKVSQTLIEGNKLNNCALICKEGTGKENNVMIVELYYEQPQLFGFPLISNPISDPVPIYTYAIFRDIISQKEQ